MAESPVVITPADINLPRSAPAAPPPPPADIGSDCALLVAREHAAHTLTAMHLSSATSLQVGAGTKAEVFEFFSVLANEWPTFNSPCLSSSADLVPHAGAELSNELQGFLSTWGHIVDFGALEVGFDSQSARTPSIADTKTSALDVRRNQRPKFATARERHKFTVDALTQEARALEERLDQLQKSQRALEARTSGDTKHCDQLLPPRTAATWKQTAAREHDRLQDALHENKRLRLRVLEEKKLFKRMRQMILIRAAKYASLAKDVQLAEPWSELPLALRVDDAMVFCRLIGELNAMHTNSASAFSKLLVVESRLPLGSLSHKPNVRIELTEFVGLEVTASSELPFGMSEVESAMRVVHFQKRTEHEYFDAERYGGSSDTAVQKWMARVHIASGSGIGCAHKVYRTVVCDSYMLAMSSGYIALTEALSYPANGILLNHQTLRFFTPSKDPSSSTGTRRKESTLIRTFSTVKVTSIQEPCAAGWEKEFIQRTLLPYWKDALAFGDQSLVNALVDRQSSLART